MIILEIILVIFLGSFLAPRSLIPWLIATIIPIFAWIIWVINRPLPFSDNWGSLDRFLISTALFLGVLPVAIRLALMLKRADHDLPKANWLPTQVSMVAVLIWVLGWLLSPTFAKVFGAAVTIVAGLLASAVAWLLFRWRSKSKALFLSASISLFAGVMGILAWPPLVIRAAEAAAANRPYCLLVARGSHYRPAANVLDLTPLVMRGMEGSGRAFSFHGEIVIADQPNRNWSYLRVGFTDEAHDYRRPTCRMSTHFAERLPWF